MNWYSESSVALFLQERMFMGVFDDDLADLDDGGGESRQLPTDITVREFGEVNFSVRGGQMEVNFTILMKPDKSQGWQTGVALDASESMRADYGRSLDSKGIPKEVIQGYLHKGWAKHVTVDGNRSMRLEPQAIQDAKQNGYLQYTKNRMEPVARKITAYLAKELDEDGGTTVVYWACGAGGGEYEVVGDVTADQCMNLKLNGPTKTRFGQGTRLTPVARYFVDRFHDANKGIYIFLTDGRIDDEDELTRYTVELARGIEAGRVNDVKFVLVGIGKQIDQAQMLRLDDLETGTEIDIWDHKIAAEMRDILDLFAEVVNENMIVAPWAKIYDDSGRVVKDLPRGLTAFTEFTMPASSEYFELQLPDRRLRQPMTV